MRTAARTLHASTGRPRGRPGPAASLALLLLCVAPATTAAQRVVHVPNEPTCTACRIEIERVATLGEFTDPVSIDHITRFAADLQGRFYAAPILPEGEIGVYDLEDGLLRTLGRAGRGPGEYGLIMHLMVDAGGSLHVFDWHLRTVLAPGDRSVARLSRLRGRLFDAVPLPDGRVLVNGNVPTANAIGLPFHVVDPDGTIVRSFGDQVPVRPPRSSGAVSPQALLIQGLTEISDGRFWAARLFGEYRINQWDTAGHHLRTLIRDAPWVEWEGRLWDPRGEDPPPSRITSLRLDDAGRLWVIAVVPEPNWEPAPEEVEFDAHWRSDVVVEVVDVENGRLLAAKRHPGPIWAFAGGEFAYAVRYDAASNIVADIWRVRLVRSAETARDAREMNERAW